MRVQLRALDDDDSGTCDWGGCDDEAVLARHDPAVGWLPVCGHHAYARHLSVVSPTPATDPATGSGAVDEMDPSLVPQAGSVPGGRSDIPRTTGHT